MKSAFLFSLTLIFFVIPLGFYSQESSWSLEYRQKFGFLAAHRGSMAHLPERLAYPFELIWYRKQSGSKKWHQTYKLPEQGLSLFHGSVGNDSILGKFTGIYGFIHIPIIRPTNTFRLDWQFGSGLGYTPKMYDPINNPKNIAIGSHINGLICLGVYSKYYFGPNKLSVGLDITHFSNGAFDVPNLGINIFYGSISYARRFGKINSKQNLIPLDEKYKNWNLGATGIFMMKETYNDNPKKYPVYGLNFYARKVFNPKAGLEVSLDLISKQAIKAYFPEIPKSQWDIFQMGIFAAYLLPIDHFHFVFGMGAYIKDKIQPEDPVYHKIGMRYQFNNGVNLQWVLKTHFGRADYSEAGIGYCFPLKKRKLKE
ncbi:MAG: acyloxyacyl hydrolase [Bacteroidota bacterium]